MAFHNIPPNGFPDLPDMEELEAVVKDVASIKTSVAGLSTDVSNLNDNKANQITIAPFFDPEASYEVGDLVYYNGLSYRCTNDHEGEWDADDFAATTVAGELATLKSGLTNLKYHKVAESASTGTYAAKLQSLASAYNSLSFAQKLSALLVMNTVDVYLPVNCSGNWFSVWIDSTGAYTSRYGIDGSAYVETGGTVTDNSSVENANVFELWICEP